MKFLELALMGLIGMIIGGAITSYYWNEEVHDFKVDAIYNECGFWTAEGKFDWKSPELTMEKD